MHDTIDGYLEDFVTDGRKFKAQKHDCHDRT